MTRQRKHPPHIGQFQDRSVRIDMTGQRFGDYTLTKAGYRGYWFGVCDAGHERLLNGGQLRADRKAGIGRANPACEECAKAERKAG